MLDFGHADVDTIDFIQPRRVGDQLKGVHCQLGWGQSPKVKTLPYELVEGKAYTALDYQ